MEKNINPGKLAPFKKNLRESVKFLEIEGNHKKVIRTNSAEEAAKGKKLFDELNSRYGVRVGADVVIGEGYSEKGRAFILTDKVDGKSLDNVGFGFFEKKDRQKFTDEVKELLISLIGYLFDKIKKREPFLWDIFLDRQYMWGRTSQDREKHIYLVDTDIFITNFDTNDINSIFWQVAVERAYQLLNFIEKIENLLKIQLSEARNRLNELVSFVDKEHKFKSEILALDLIKKRLSRSQS